MTSSSELKVQVWRGDVVESEHRVQACVVNEQGQVLQSFGDPNFNTYLRSAAKPFQAIPFVHSGASQYFDASPAELALACSSHLGQEIHITGVKSLLKKASVAVTDLQNHEHVKNNEGFYCCEHPVQDEDKILKQNCSGKHAAFLATQKFLQDDLKNYLQPDSKLQSQILKAIHELSGVDIKRLQDTLVPDGCGAPIMALPLKAVAKMYAKLGARQAGIYQQSLQQIFAAMAEHPLMIRGEGDFNTDLIRAFSGKLVAKLGYEGVYGVALSDGRGLALKVLDGNLRALAPAVIFLLKQLLPAEKEAFIKLQAWEVPVMQNIHHVTVGKISVV